MADVGAVLELGGVSQFQNAMKVAANMTKAFDAELKGLAAQFETTGSKEDNLARRNDVLRNSLDNSKNKVNALSTELTEQRSELDRLEQAIQDATTEYGENSTEVAKAQREYAQQSVKVSKLERDYAKAEAEVNQMTSELNKNETEMKQLQTETEQAGRKMKRFGDDTSQAGKRGATGIKQIATAVGLVRVVEEAFQAVTSSVGDAVSRFDTLNNFPRIMQNLGYSAGEADAAITKLSDGIDGLPTALDDVAGTAQNLAPLVGGLDKATDTTLALNNAFLASGKSGADASRGMEQYTQMLSKGEVDLQSWKTLEETMPVALSQTAKALGITSGKTRELYDKMKSGEISMDDFNQAIVTMSEEGGAGFKSFADQAKEASGGVATSWQNVKTAIAKGLEGVIKAIDTSLQNAGLGTLADNINKAKEGIATAFGTIASMMPTVIGIISGLATAFNNLKYGILAVVGVIAVYKTAMAISSIIHGVTMALAGEALATDASTWAKRSNAITTAMLTIKQGLLKVATLASSAATKTATIAQLAYGKAMGVASIVANTAALVANKIAVIASSVATKAAALAQTALNAAMSAGRIIAVTAALVAQQAILAASAIATKAVTAAQWLFNAALNANPIVLIVTLIAGLIAAVIYLWKTNETFRDIVTGVWEAIWTRVSAIGGALKKFFTVTIPGFLKTAWGKIKQATKLIIAVFIGWPVLVIRAITPLLAKLVGWARQIPAKIKSGLSNLAAIGGHLVTGFWKGVTDKAGWLVGMIQSFATNVKDKLKSFFGIKSPSRETAWMGEMLTQGLGVGMMNAINYALSAADNVGTAITDRLSDMNATGLGYDFGSDLSSGINQGMGNINTPSMDSQNVVGAVVSGIANLMAANKTDGTLVINLDGKEIARNTVSHMPAINMQKGATVG
jgi:tape measure domain